MNKRKCASLFGSYIIFFIFLVVICLIVNYITYREVPIQITEIRQDDRVLLIDNYYKERNMPLQGYGKKMVEIADKYGIDPYLLPAISIRESSGGKHACGNNPFGWGSCKKITFSSLDEAIETVGKNLGGQNPRTSSYYKNTSTYQKLYYYNGTVVKTYPDEVIKIIEKIKNDKNRSST